MLCLDRSCRLGDHHRVSRGAQIGRFAETFATSHTSTLALSGRKCTCREGQIGADSVTVIRHHGGVSTDIKERPDTTTDETTSDDTPKFFHYVKKNKIAESAVMGTHVVALCGEVFPVTRSAKPGSPVCPECKKVYEGLRKGE